MKPQLNRRKFLRDGSVAAGALALSQTTPSLRAQVAGDRPSLRSDSVEVVNPRNRVPLSFIIDDSTCLVNLAHFCIPQFAEVFPDRYQQDWRSLPREIPDSFVRKFGEWCHAAGVKGKYSIVPYPACVGWMDRDIPGWTKRELENSLDLVRELMLPDWDIHPEMISHTWVINTKTGRPYEDRSEYFMENWRWTDGKSVDQLADYLAYALRVLKNAGLPCDGVTTPGGFGNRVLPELSQATLESCRDVYQTEIPHYFRHLYTDDRSVAPRVEYVSGLDSDDPRCVVSIIGCTGDWFGGWDGVTPGDVDRFITPDLKSGRMVEVIERGEPAIMVCHWPGIYYNGEELGFNIFKEAVRRVHAKYDHVHWMKLSEISRYWAAKELTSIQRSSEGISFQAPFASPDFTCRISGRVTSHPKLIVNEWQRELNEVRRPLELRENTWTKVGEDLLVCFDLPRGTSRLVF